MSKELNLKVDQDVECCGVSYPEGMEACCGSDESAKAAEKEECDWNSSEVAKNPHSVSCCK
ncbi:hypothetical protein SAMN04487944_12613 [Gracilibacillus ureilyticus]|uniref:Uncharacterized protein n=1 Tax=Gracilibacillus ureilyticus TaxID=531814 RepID=A0A1H9VR90_9BACI|nr:hypothetical protein [Gracilibacillus ureilyticus]SES23753.1 hypothetical protein SAMN04487944_12613 [Gracilibacillus ureilyticus]